MSRVSSLFLAAFAIAATAAMTGCGYQAIEPGHRGLRFDPHEGGLQREVLQPGNYKLGVCVLRDCGRIEDFDVTYTTKYETVHSITREGLTADLRLSIIYRPIVSELYELDTEVGQKYFEEVIQPEFVSATRGVVARHSFMDFQVRNVAFEDEIENELRNRTRGKHVEISSVSVEEVHYAPEVEEAMRKHALAAQKKSSPEPCASGVSQEAPKQTPAKQELGGLEP